ncbi:MAG: ATP-dependent helicase, partial [Streptomyces sp.]
MGTAPGEGIARCAAVFVPGEPAREGKVAFWRPDGGTLPEPGPGTPDTPPYELTVARRHGNGARARTVPAVLVPLPDALPPLIRARHDPAAHPAAACWGAAALHAVHLVARGRLLPGLSGPEDIDAWRAGPLDAQDVAQVRAIAAAMPAEAHAVPVPGGKPLRLPDPENLVRALLDAVADTLPRTPAAPYAAGEP